MTRVDATRVAVSNFPRHNEIQTVCLMTVACDRSGSEVALAKSPGYLSAWRPYMFSRLTCHSDSDWLIQRTISGLLAVPEVSERVSFGGRADSVSCLSLGAFPASHVPRAGSVKRHAPVKPAATKSWSTATPVDSAGWTQVVIQERRRAFSDVNTGFRAEVNASINEVTGRRASGDWLHSSGGGSFKDSACGRYGLCDMDDSKLSCTNNNEVTR
jgi:hypothetical protein